MISPEFASAIAILTGIISFGLGGVVSLMVVGGAKKKDGCCDNECCTCHDY